jgi:hypothetical protein
VIAKAFPNLARLGFLIYGWCVVGADDPYNKVIMDDAFEAGPAMAVLTPLQRKYVLAMACDPFATPAEWARVAGYKESPNGNVRVQGHYLSHNPKIEAAIQEVSRAMLYREGPMLAAAGLLMIARNKNHPKHLRALETLANRVGLHETTEHTVKVEHTDLTGAAMAERIMALAAKHGMDPEKLLGGNSAPAVDAEFTVVPNAE